MEDISKIYWKSIPIRLEDISKIDWKNIPIRHAYDIIYNILANTEINIPNEILINIFYEARLKFDFHYIPDKHMNMEFIKEVLTLYPNFLKTLPEQYMNEEIVFKHSIAFMSKL